MKKMKKAKSFPEHKHDFKNPLPTLTKMLGKPVCKCGKVKP